MNTRRFATVAVLLALATIIVSSAVPASEALTQDDLYFNTIDDGDMSVSLQSGGTATVNLYVTNQCDSSVAIDVESITGLGSSFETSYSIEVLGSSNSSVGVLMPSGQDGSIAVITLTIKADVYADTQTVTGSVRVLANGIGDDSGHTEFVLPITVNVSSAFTTDDAYNKFFGVFPNTLDSPFDATWFTALATLVLWLIATVLASEVIIPLFTRLVGARKTDEEKRFLRKRLTMLITALMAVISINECMLIVGANAEVTHFVGACSNVVYVVIGAYISWMVYLFIVTAFLKGINEAAEVDGMDMSLLPLFKMIGKLVIIVFAVCAALAAFGVDFAGIMVSAGVVTLGITLGAQEILGQFFSGIVLLASRPFKKGDFIQINGTTYRVRKVRLMYTELENWDFDQIVTMPNNTVSAATLVNLSSMDYRRTRVFIYVDVAYGTDIDKAKASLEAAGRKHPHVINDGSCIPPNARVTEFADSGVTMRLACYVDDFNNSAHYAGQIRELVYKQLNEDGIEIPYNRIQVDVLTNPSDHRRADGAGQA